MGIQAITMNLDVVDISISQMQEFCLLGLVQMNSVLAMVGTEQNTKPMGMDYGLIVHLH